MKQAEQWRPVVGFEDSHQVSDRGRVRSVGRVVHKRDRTHQTIEGRLLQPRLSEDGTYLVVRLCKGGRGYWRSVARLVTEAFLPAPRHKKGYTVHYIDGRKENVCVSNLRWLDKNQQWELRKKRGSIALGEDNPMAVMTEADVRRIRRDTRPGSKACVDYGISKTTFLAIRSRRSWIHVRD